jgi:hypothetical protein
MAVVEPEIGEVAGSPVSWMRSKTGISVSHGENQTDR